ncbi:MAG: hypothetical protein AAGG07_09390 [Planctomycetota bacterium]
MPGDDTMASAWLAKQTTTPLDLSPGQLRIALDDTRPPTPDEATLARWETMRRAKPRLFNGPMLAFTSWDAESFTVHSVVDGYQRLAVQPEVPTGVMQLSVTGVLLARDGLGREHVLLGKRADATRLYEGMWELAPSGGIDPPPTDAMLDSGARLDGFDAWRQLVLEIEEELDLAIAPDPGQIVGLVSDPVAMSTDLVFRVELTRPLEEMRPVDDPSTRTSDAGWEYRDTRWVATDEIGAFDLREPAEIIPPTRALFRMLGWVR